VTNSLVSRPAAARTSLPEIAYDAITEAIFTRRIEPGARLLIDHLAADLEMSITPVREALARTTAAGLTRRDANRGYTVEPLLDADGFHLLFAARRTIELAAITGTGDTPARWLADLPNAQLRAIRGTLTRMAKLSTASTYASYSRFSQLDNELHFALVRNAGNPFLATAWDSLHFHLHMSRLYGNAGVVDYEDAHAEHCAIVDAVTNRDGEALCRACEAHMTGAEHRLAALLR